ncbi:MAG: WD40/YVTN/BNR-like repeat-containing protein [bacterium]
MVEFPLTDGARGYAMGYDTAVLSLRLFVSLDSGATWRPPHPGFIFGRSGWFLTDPIVPNRIYAYTTTGIFRSDDGGDNWVEHHTGIRLAHISTVAVSPNDSSRVYLEYYENGIFKSFDGGNTWHRCTQFLDCGNICGIGITPGTSDDVLYALEGKG